MRKLVYLLLSALTWSCTSNLVKNPGAESTPVGKEWNAVSGKWMQRKTAPLPAEGKAYFFPSVAGHAELIQDVDVSSYGFFTDLGLMKIHYTSYMRAFPQSPADQSYQVVEFRNGEGAVLDSFTSAHIDSTKNWIKYDVEHSLPNGSRAVRIRLLSDRFNGSNNDGYHDAIMLTVSLSWWVYLFSIILIIAIGSLWFRKKRRPKTVKKVFASNDYAVK